MVVEAFSKGKSFTLSKMNRRETEGAQADWVGAVELQALGPTIAPLVMAELGALLDKWDAVAGSWSGDEIAAMRMAIRRSRANLEMLRPVLDFAWVDEMRRGLKPLGQQLSRICQRDAVHELAQELVDQHRVRDAVAARIDDSGDSRAVMLADTRELFTIPAGLRAREALIRVADTGVPLRDDPDADTWKPCQELLPGMVFRPLQEMRRAGKIDNEHRRLDKMRRATRHVRYASELVTPVLGSVAAELAHDAAALQHVLRRHRDAAALLEWSHGSTTHDHALSHAARAFFDGVTQECVSAMKPRLSKTMESGHKLGNPVKGFRIVAAGGVVWRTNGNDIDVVLVHRSRQGDWSLPKGKADPGEAVEQCALREVSEETGLSCELGGEVTRLHYRDGRGVRKDVTYYSMLVARSTAQGRPDPREIDAVIWTPIGQAPAVLTRERERGVLEVFQTMVPA